MMADECMAADCFDETFNEKWNMDTHDDDSSMLDYESFLQTDVGDYDDLDDFDDDEFFESSQLHRLIHTQPIHMINQNALFSCTADSMNTQPQELHTTIDTLFPSNTSQSATTSRSSSLFSATLPPEEESRTASASYDFFDSIEEANDNFDEPLLDHKHDHKPPACSNTNLQIQLNNLIPRSVPQKKVDLKLCLDMGSFSKQHETGTFYSGSNYHYSIKSSHKQQNPPQALGEDSLLIRTLNAKLSRYAGYYTADSKDQEYSDKVRFQEISYKFSKTYF